MLVMKSLFLQTHEEVILTAHFTQTYIDYGRGHIWKLQQAV
jgi:hypothetical protein